MNFMVLVSGIGIVKNHRSTVVFPKASFNVHYAF